MSVRFIVVIALLLGACGDYTVTVRGADDSELSYEALFLQTDVCPIESALGGLTSVESVPLSGGSFSVGSLSRERAAVVILGRDDNCAIRAFGCQVLEPSPGSSATIPVSDVGPVGGCGAAESCMNRQCVGDGVDAGPADAGPMDAGRSGCLVQDAERMCEDNADCMLPFASCVTNRCVAVVDCDEREVMFDPAVEVQDVAIEGRGGDVEVNYITDSGSYLYGSLVSPDDTDRISPVDLNHDHSFGAEQPVGILMQGDLRVAVFPGGVQRMSLANYGPPPSILTSVPRPTLATWTGLAATALTRSDTLVFAYTGYMSGTRSGDPLVISESAGNDTEGAHVPFSRSVIAMVGSEGPRLAVLVGNEGVHVWDSTPLLTPEPRGSVDLAGITSTTAPGWAHIGTDRYSLVTVTASTTIYEVNCPSACAVESTEEVTPDTFDQVQLLETDNGRFLVARSAGDLHVLLLSRGDNPLIARFPVSEGVMITDFDAHVFEDGLYITAMDDAGAHFYSVTAP